VLLQSKIGDEMLELHYKGVGAGLRLTEVNGNIWEVWGRWGI
jgi:hypothetical protein